MLAIAYHIFSQQNHLTKMTEGSTDQSTGADFHAKIVQHLNPKEFCKNCRGQNIHEHITISFQ